MKRELATVVLGLAAATSAARAEPVRVGPRAGLTVSWLSELNAPVVGATAGVVASIPLLPQHLYVEPGLVFTMKGGGWSAGEGGEDKRYDYVEVPLVLRYGGAPGFFAGLGLAPALLVHEWRVSHGGVSTSEARRFDLSVLVEGGYAWERIRFDVALEMGVVAADRSNSAAPPDSRTRALSCALAWLF